MEFCDLECVYAEFPKETALDGSGSCRTFLALWCKKRETYVLKNAVCREKKPKKP